MGDYLTYTDNKAYSYAKKYPDENYARELQQLFTIGVWMLNPDGSEKLDSAGNRIASYRPMVTAILRMLRAAGLGYPSDQRVTIYSVLIWFQRMISTL